MKCDRKWWNDGRLEREYAEQAARDEAQRQLEMRAHPQPCFGGCMLCYPRYDLVAQLHKPIPTAVVRSACGQYETPLRPQRIISDPQPTALDAALLEVEKLLRSQASMWANKHEYTDEAYDAGQAHGYVGAAMLVQRYREAQAKR